MASGMHPEELGRIGRELPFDGLLDPSVGSASQEYAGAPLRSEHTLRQQGRRRVAHHDLPRLGRVLHGDRSTRGGTRDDELPM
jgi:hypothetical protein